MSEISTAQVLRGENPAQKIAKISPAIMELARKEQAAVESGASKTLRVRALSRADQLALEEQVDEERRQASVWGGSKILKITPDIEDAVRREQASASGPPKILKIAPEPGIFRKSGPAQTQNQLPYQVGQRVRLRGAGYVHVGTIDRIEPVNGGFFISAKGPGGLCSGVYRPDDISAA